MNGLEEHGQGVPGERPYPQDQEPGYAHGPWCSGGHRHHQDELQREIGEMREWLGVIAASQLQTAASQQRAEETQRHIEEKIMNNQGAIDAATAAMNAAVTAIQGDTNTEDVSGLEAATSALNSAVESANPTDPAAPADPSQPQVSTAPGLAP